MCLPPTNPNLKKIYQQFVSFESCFRFIKSIRPKAILSHGSVEQSSLHRITSVGKPIRSVHLKNIFSPKERSLPLLGRQGEEPIARHRKTPRVLCGGRYVRCRGYEAFAPLKAQKPPPPGIPKGSQPLGAAFFPGVSLQKQRNPD